MYGYQKITSLTSIFLFSIFLIYLWHCSCFLPFLFPFLEHFLIKRIYLATRVGETLSSFALSLPLYLCLCLLFMVLLFYYYFFDTLFIVFARNSYYSLMPLNLFIISSKYYHNVGCDLLIWVCEGKKIRLDSRVNYKNCV